MCKFKEGYIGQFEDEKRNLYLVYDDSEELIAAHISLEEAYREINRYLKKVNFRSYYLRSWDASKEHDRRMVMDFGSYYKFFHWANGPRIKKSVCKESKPTYTTMTETLTSAEKEDL